jgi:hypothetical protein
MSAQPLPSLLPAIRQVFRLIRSLPDAQRRAAGLEEARAALRSRAREADPARVLEYRKELHAKLGYLRIVAPRAPGAVSSDTGTATYVFRDGQFVEGRGGSHGTRRVAAVLVQTTSLAQLVVAVAAARSPGIMPHLDLARHLGLQGGGRLDQRG